MRDVYRERPGSGRPLEPPGGQARRHSAGSTAQMALRAPLRRPAITNLGSRARRPVALRGLSVRRAPWHRAAPPRFLVSGGLCVRPEQAARDDGWLHELLSGGGVFDEHDHPDLDGGLDGLFDLLPLNDGGIAAGNIALPKRKRAPRVFKRCPR